jgi:ribosome-associated translation inhibitor RaiA
MSEQEQKFQAELAERIQLRRMSKLGISPQKLPVITTAAPETGNEEKPDTQKPCKKEDCTGKCADCEKSTKIGAIIANLATLTDQKAALSNSLHTFPPEDSAGRANVVRQIDSITTEMQDLINLREAINKSAGVSKVVNVPVSSIVDANQKNETTYDEIKTVLNLRSKISKLRAKLKNNHEDVQAVESLAKAQVELDKLLNNS